MTPKSFVASAIKAVFETEDSYGSLKFDPDMWSPSMGVTTMMLITNAMHAMKKSFCDKCSIAVFGNPELRCSACHAHTADSKTEYHCSDCIGTVEDYLTGTPSGRLLSTNPGNPSLHEGIVSIVLAGANLRGRYGYDYGLFARLLAKIPAILKPQALYSYMFVMNELAGPNVAVTMARMHADGPVLDGALAMVGLPAMEGLTMPLLIDDRKGWPTELPPVNQLARLAVEEFKMEPFHLGHKHLEYNLYDLLDRRPVRFSGYANYTLPFRFVIWQLLVRDSVNFNVARLNKVAKQEAMLTGVERDDAKIFTDLVKVVGELRVSRRRVAVMTPEIQAGLTELLIGLIASLPSHSNPKLEYLCVL